MTKTLVFYNRTTGCPLSTLARRILDDHGVDYREVYYDLDPQAKARLLRWTGFLSVPTLVVTENGADDPLTPPNRLDPGTSPRGIDRGSIITEPSADQLLAWLQKHGFLAADYSAAG